MYCTCDTNNKKNVIYFSPCVSYRTKTKTMFEALEWIDYIELN